MRTLIAPVSAVLFGSMLIFGCEAQPEPEMDPAASDTANGLEATDTTMAGETQIMVTQAEPYGAYLTDAQGRSVYLFMADSAKTGSSCYDACAEAWPPVLAEGEPTGGPEADAAMLGTIQRTTGETQVTYNDWPLYYFVQDQGAGQTTGQDVDGFGAEWYLVSPQGEAVHAEGEGQ